MLGHLQRANASRSRASGRIRPDGHVGFARSAGATHPDRRVRPDVSVHQIWVTDASVGRGALSARVLLRGYRPRMAATQRAIAMLVKGWACRLAVCCAAPSRCSTPWHWQLPAPSDAWRGHFNADRPVEHTDAAFFPTVLLHTTARPWSEALDRGEDG
jgi:hypothetical protein